MAERGVIVGHSTRHRWFIRLVPLPDKVFRRYKWMKRASMSGASGNTCPGRRQRGAKSTFC
ncbi:Uncharacterised protein [Escherichia coli]|nr:Uncharacterised protein [Escherichia coli]